MFSIIPYYFQVGYLAFSTNVSLLSEIRRVSVSNESVKSELEPGNFRAIFGCQDSLGISRMEGI